MITLILYLVGMSTLQIDGFLYDPSRQVFEYEVGGVVTDCTGVSSFAYDNTTVTIDAAACSPDRIYGNGFQ